MAYRRFEGKKHAKIYAKHRITAPEELNQRIIEYTTEKCQQPLTLAVDVGCGPGISTYALSKYFAKLIGTDISQAMINEARENNQKENVTFIVSPAESIPAEDSSVQLITASHAAHWFDLPKFYDEAKRVLCPGGTMALYGYGLFKLLWKKDPSKNEMLVDTMEDLEIAILDGPCPPALLLALERYKDVHMPLNDLTRDDSFYHEVNITVSDVFKYVATWSPYQELCKKKGEAAAAAILCEFEQRIMNVIGVETSPEETYIVKRSEYYLLLGRK